MLENSSWCLNKRKSQNKCDQTCYLKTQKETKSDWQSWRSGRSTDRVSIINPNYFQHRYNLISNRSLFLENQLFWYKLFKECLSPVQNAFCETLKKLVYHILRNQHFNLFESCDFSQFWSKMAQRSILEWIIDPFMTQRCQKKLYV